MSIRARLASLKGLLHGLREEDLAEDPIEQFKVWYAAARRSGIYLPDAFALSTVDPDGRPSARMMLLKGVDVRGFVFFTNYESRKGEALRAHDRVALTFHWNELMRQVRIEGRAERTSEAESLAYFETRGRGSRIGAWASPQSRVLETRVQLEDKVREIEARYAGREIPLPPHWGGFRVTPERIEFWQGRPDRLHDRHRYDRDGEAWTRARLAP